MAQEVVKALLVELDGNIEKLRKVLRDGGVELDNFGKRAKQSNATAAAGADMTASKQANAARAIASATETMARQGKVSGEAAKQLIAQGANALLMFGPQGAVVGAIGIATLAVVGHFSRIKREAEEAAEAAKKSIADLLNAGDVEGLKAEARKLYGGTRANNFEDGLVARRRRVAALSAELESPTTNPFNVGPRMSALEKERAKLVELEAQYQTLRTTILGFAQDPLGLSGATPIRFTAAAPGADARSSAKELREELAETAAAQRELDSIRERADQSARAVVDLVRRELGSAADQLRAEFNRQIEQAMDAGRERDVDMLIDLRDRAVAAAEAIGRAELSLQRLDLAAAQGARAGVDAFQELTAHAEALQRELATLTPGTARYKAVIEALEKVEKRRTDLLKDVADANEVGDKTRAASRGMAEYAREIQQAADGALQLAQNLGGASAETVGLLRGIGQIAGNLPALQKALTPGKDGAPISGMAVLGASLPILGALSSMLGQSPAEQQRREELRANTDAIRELTKTAGQLGLGVTGDASSRAAGQLRGFLGSDLANNPVVANRVARGLASAYGLNLKELDEIAAKHGITLNGNIESFRQLAAALDATRMKLGEFGTDLDSQRRQADAEIAIRGITDPLEQWAIRQGAYAGRSSALDGVTAGLDLSTAEGRAQARANAEALFAIMRAGGGTLGEGALGGLSGDELLQALLDLVDSLDALDETASTASASTLGAVSGYTGLSAAAGSRIEDYNRALVGYARDAQGTRLAMLTALESLVARTLGPIPVPPMFDGATARAGQGGTTIQIMVAEGAVQLQFSVSGDARAIASAVGDGFEATMSDRLARAIIRARQATGDLSVGPA